VGTKYVSRRQVKALENELQESRIQKQILTHEINRQEETHTQEIILLKKQIEALQNKQPALPEIRASSQDHSASRQLNESVQHYHPALFYERTLALPPQMIKAMNHPQPVVLEHSTSATPLQDHSTSRILNEAMQH
jgi:hypothetical protein